MRAIWPDVARASRGRGRLLFPEPGGRGGGGPFDHLAHNELRELVGRAGPPPDARVWPAAQDRYGHHHPSVGLDDDLAGFTTFR